MDLIDHLQNIAARAEKQVSLLSTEEATKNALVMPVLNALGYNVFDPTEVVPEFVADVGVKKGEKVDYAIFINGAPMILVECKAVGAELCLKHASQLFRYFSTTAARFAILTNGINYHFYTDIEAPNKMDEKPFFEFNLLNMEEGTVIEFKKFSKSQFDLEKILSNASELKYTKQIKKLVEAQIEAPSEELVRFFARQVYDGILTATIREQFVPIVTNAFRAVIKDRINDRIKSALDTSPSTIPAVVAPVEEPTTTNVDSLVVTTDEEREAFYIVRGILAKRVHPSRVIMRDTQSYCGILLDDNNRKPICRLRFNSSKKFLGVFDAAKNETRHSINEPVDIYQFEEALLEILRVYDPAVAVKA